MEFLTSGVARSIRVAIMLLAWQLILERTLLSQSWPHYAAGNRAPDPTGVELVDGLQDARKVFETTDCHAGVGKALYGKQRRLGEAMGVSVLPGGTSSPIVAARTIYIAYYRPSGEARLPGDETTFRTLKTREGWSPDIWCIAADDCLLAIDARSGERRWLQVHEGKGLNRVTIKRNDWGPAPCHHDGRVFFLGTTGRVYAHDAASGELLWEAQTPAHAALAAAKAEALRRREWGPKHGLHTGCIVAEDVLIVATIEGNGLLGLDARNGDVQWTLQDDKERYQSDLATPRVWKHGAREYVLAVNRAGTMSVIDPKDGEVLWRHASGGTNHGTVALDGDIVILNTKDQPEDVAKGATLWGAFRLATDGPEHLWTLPDRRKYWHQWKHDNGPRPKFAVRDGIAWLAVGDAVKEQPRRLLAVEIATGKILSETDLGRLRATPLWVEDRLLLWHDLEHGHPLKLSYWTADSRGPRQLTALTELPATAITGYLVPMDTPYGDGRLYLRTLGGAAAFDLRAEGER